MYECRVRLDRALRGGQLSLPGAHSSHSSAGSRSDARARAGPVAVARRPSRLGAEANSRSSWSGSWTEGKPLRRSSTKSMAPAALARLGRPAIPALGSLIVNTNCRPSAWPAPPACSPAGEPDDQSPSRVLHAGRVQGGRPARLSAQCHRQTGVAAKQAQYRPCAQDEGKTVGTKVTPIASRQVNGR